MAAVTQRVSDSTFAVASSRECGTQLEINKATQIVEAIAQTIDCLPDPERLLAALDELSTAVASLLLEHRP